ncbi:hypothetical protein [Tumebacillus avium]|nr:hypothetical protein [Tumebacillus avium]
MKNELADLTQEQHQRINQLEAQLGVVLIAYAEYQQENNSGQPQHQQ